jgi:hypothetical protein
MDPSLNSNTKRKKISQITQIFTDMNSQRSVFICEINEKHNAAVGDAALNTNNGRIYKKAMRRSNLLFLAMLSTLPNCSLSVTLR